MALSMPLNGLKEEDKEPIIELFVKVSARPPRPGPLSRPPRLPAQGASREPGAPGPRKASPRGGGRGRQAVVPVRVGAGRAGLVTAPHPPALRPPSPPLPEPQPGARRETANSTSWNAF